MNVFVTVVEEEGFAAAARRLRMSPPAVTRAVADLERRIGVRLLNRTTRHVRTTEAGQHYLEDTRRILAEVDAADEAVAGTNREPRGHLSVTAPVLFGRMFVMPGIIDYLERYPETSVSAMFLDRIVNLLEEGLEVGVRIGELADSTMQARRVGSVRLILCASPAYFSRYGRPLTPQELKSHSIVASSAGSQSVGWQFETTGGLRPLRIQPRLSVTTNDGAIEAALQGFGITRVLSYQVAPQIETGGLEVVLSEFEPTPRPIHIVYREGRNAPAKVRTFVDLMVDRLRADHALNQ